MPESTLARAARSLSKLELIDQLERTDLTVRCLLLAIDVAASLPEHSAAILQSTADGARRRLALSGNHV